jgi:transporter family-2 protein
MAGLLIDHYGIFDAPVTKMTLMRALGAVLEIAGIAFISAEKTGNGGRGLNGRTLLFIVFDILAGFAAAAQVAINGTMAVVAGSPVRSTLISMCGALLTMTVICCLLSVFGGRTAVFDEKNPPAGRVRFTPFFLTGGLMALVVVGGNAITGPVLGTGMVTMMNLFGMMAAGLAIDATGFLGIEVKPVTKPKLLGMAMMLAGTALISF